MRRVDESEDSVFYQQPRFAAHIDEECQTWIQKQYRDQLEAHFTVLDLMSSWTSYLEKGTVDFLKGLGTTRELSLRMLTYRTLMLVCLTNIPRASEVTQMTISRKSDLPDRMAFFFKYPTKNDRERSGKYRKKPKEPLEVFRFQDDEELCPVSHLQHYLERTFPLRNGADKIFIALTKPHQGVTPETISRWLRDILKRSGIDTSVFTSHSIRHASSSKAKVRGATVKDIMDKGRWASTSTWHRFYYKQVLGEEPFQRAVLQGFGK